MAEMAGAPLRTALVDLVGELEQRGLSRDAVLFWVEFCRRSTTGAITFHHVHGKIEYYEPHYKKHMATGELHLTRL
jgi:hypothetical protein